MEDEKFKYSLDNPMSSLNLGWQADFLTLLLKLKQEGKTVILTSQNPNQALEIKESCRRYLFNKGTIIGFGDYQDVLTTENIHMVYGNRVFVDTESKSIGFHIVDDI